MMNRTRKHSIALALVIVAATAIVGCSRQGQPASSSTSTGSITVAVIPKGTTHEFWQSIHAGANKAGKELGVGVIWRGPLREDDRDAQVSEVEGFISRGVSGIALAPLDESALVGPVADAMSRHIPVVIFDSGLKGDNYVSFVATDNIKGGRMAGERVAQSIGGKGKVVLLRYAEGHDSTGKREQGFLDAMAAHPGIKVISSNQYAGTDVEGAYKKAEALLSSFKNPDGSLGVDGMFCANESSTFAVLRVLQENGWAGKVKFVGFDASPGLVKGLRDGGLDGLIVQDPVQMGYLAVKTMVTHLKGGKVERMIDTGVHLVTRDTMDQTEMKELLAPDLSQWLK
jgi:ribose transport system substrate-binding protein